MNKIIVIDNYNEDNNKEHDYYDIDEVDKVIISLREAAKKVPLYWSNR